MASKRKVTSKRVAELAGVSQTTVSFVLNNVDRANISEETRRRVHEAAETLGYVPDMAARALARGRSANIGLVLVQPHKQIFADSYIPNVIAGLSQVVKKAGYRILVEMIDAGSHPNTYVDLIRGKEVAGLVVNLGSPSVAELEETAGQLATYALEGYPILTLDEYHPDLPSVMVDRLTGVRQVVQHLIDMGHTCIACITYAPTNVNLHAEIRLEVYRETLRQAGIQPDEALVRYGVFDPDTGYAAMQSLLDGYPVPTAIYAMNDVMAFGAMTAIHERGLRVPEDIAVVGFDDIRLARYTAPPLTTVFEPETEHGYAAGELLMHLINGDPIENTHIRLNTQLVIRESCGYRKAHITEPTK